MKKLLNGILVLSCLSMATSAFAASATANTDGIINLGQGGIPVGANVVLNYSTGNVAAVGGYGGCANDQTMASVSGNTKPGPSMALEFGVRSSQDPNCADDNNVYQNAPGAVITSATLSAATTDISGWTVRGAGGS